MSSTNNWHSLTAALPQFAHRHGEKRSPGRQRFGGFLGASSDAPVQAPLLSATVAAVGALSRSLIPFPQRAPQRRASGQARAPVARELSGPLLGAVCGLGLQVMPAASPSVLATLWLLDFRSPCRPSPWSWLWWRRASGQLPPRAHVQRDFTSPLPP